jgi:hypothetical protein
MLRRQRHAAALAYCQKKIIVHKVTMDDMNTILNGIEVTGNAWKPGEKAMWKVCMEIMGISERIIEDKQSQVNHVLRMNKNHDEDEAWADKARWVRHKGFCGVNAYPARR